MELGLIGLKPIREALKLSARAVCDVAGMSLKFFYQVEACVRDCTSTKVRALAEALCCTPNDLMRNPSPRRLAQIVAAYHQREADMATERARAAS